MKSNQIKHHAFLLILTGLIFVSCDHKNTEREYSERGNDVNERTNEIRNDDTLNPGSYIEMDTTDLQQNNGFIPISVYNVIRIDSSLKYQEVVESRTIIKENNIFFEVHFKLDDKITSVVFDQDGNHTNDYN
ncbi:hypothetical protein [Aquiflexum lacus]|uniref:hypothetical protein n=1 Tax=Aquiflexum lacus TaxID=2483805 RepID=UPI00189541D8|nr:hypothetical protein [Aquiflexum lacus]